MSVPHKAALDTAKSRHCMTIGSALLVVLEESCTPPWMCDSSPGDIWVGLIMLIADSWGGGGGVGAGEREVGLGYSVGLYVYQRPLLAPSHSAPSIE